MRDGEERQKRFRIKSEARYRAIKGRIEGEIMTVGRPPALVDNFRRHKCVEQYDVVFKSKSLTPKNQKALARRPHPRSPILDDHGSVEGAVSKA